MPVFPHQCRSPTIPSPWHALSLPTHAGTQACALPLQRKSSRARRTQNRMSAQNQQSISNGCPSLPALVIGLDTFPSPLPSLDPLNGTRLRFGQTYLEGYTKRSTSLCFRDYIFVSGSLAFLLLSPSPRHSATSIPFFFSAVFVDNVLACRCLLCFRSIPTTLVCHLGPPLSQRPGASLSGILEHRN
jgi:hypothetical protein